MTPEKQQTIVIKVGTDTITDVDDQLDAERMREIIEQIVGIQQATKARIILVSSGAVAAGRAEYGVKKVAGETLAQKQMYATAGQAELIHHYRTLLRTHGWAGNQVLLTQEIFDSRKRRAKLLNTLELIFTNEGKHGLPILNENDAIADEELKFGDNDQLAMMTSELVGADTLVIMTSKNGVLRDVDDSQSNIGTIAPHDETWRDHIIAVGTKNGTGGMLEKCQASQNAARHGTQVHIVDGRHEQVLRRLLLEKEPLGTTFTTG